VTRFQDIEYFVCATISPFFFCQRFYSRIQGFRLRRYESLSLAFSVSSAVFRVQRDSALLVPPETLLAFSRASKGKTNRPVRRGRRGEGAGGGVDRLFPVGRRGGGAHRAGGRGGGAGAGPPRGVRRRREDFRSHGRGALLSRRFADSRKSPTFLAVGRGAQVPRGTGNF